MVLEKHGQASPTKTIVYKETQKKGKSCTMSSELGTIPVPLPGGK